MSIPTSTFTVGDNPDKSARDPRQEEIIIRRQFPRYAMVWAMPFEDLVELQTTIATYIAGERNG